MASAINIGGTADQTLIRGAEKIAEKEYVFTKPKVDRGSAILESAIGSITDGISAIKMKKEQYESLPEDKRSVADFLVRV